MKKSRIMAMLLATSISITGLAGCNNKKENNIEKSATSTAIKVESEEEIPKISKIELYENMLEQLSLKYNFSQEDINLILQEDYNYTKEEVIIAAYLNLKNYNISIEDIYANLNNLLVQARIPRSITAEEMIYYYGKLLSTCPMYTNPVMCYSALAIDAHEHICELSHKPYYEVITCDYLEQKAEEDFALILKK